MGESKRLNEGWPQFNIIHKTEKRKSNATLTAVSKTQGAAQIANKVQEQTWRVHVLFPLTRLQHRPNHGESRELDNVPAAAAADCLGAERQSLSTQRTLHLATAK